MAAPSDSQNPDTRPLCFVLMPFGTKTDASGKSIDFNDVYQRLIRPAIEEAGLAPVRADEEQAGGVIHKPMYERLILCEYAVADLTTANANVFYELGVRHAIKPFSTILIAASDTRLPFDVGPLRTLMYEIDATGRAGNPDHDRETLAGALVTAREANTDSPLFQLVDGYRPPKIEHIKTDVFRQQVQYAEDAKRRLAAARKGDEKEVRHVEADLGPIEDVEAGVLIDLMLSYRAVKGWTAMIELVERMPRPLAQSVMVREQYAFALNRAERGEEAETVITHLIAERGPSSESYGILGRVYKDRWEAAKKAGRRAGGHLQQAIDAYLRGFQTDWRDAFPGINAVTLMELAEPPDERRHELIPVVTYAARRRIEGGEPDYWDHATLLELAVLADDRAAADRQLDLALALLREPWEAETTARNLRLIREARQERGEEADWIAEIEHELAREAGD
jgi:hypothetical protein